MSQEICKNYHCHDLLTMFTRHCSSITFNITSIYFSTSQHEIFTAANIYVVQSSLLYVHVFQRKGCAPQPLPLFEQVFLISRFTTTQKEYTYIILFCQGISLNIKE